MADAKTETAKPSDDDAQAAAREATNEAERHKTGELPAKAGRVKPTG